MASIEKGLEAAQKVWGKLKDKIEQNTTLHMHVGAGAVAPKRVYRYPSPGAVALNPSRHQTALHLARKAEDLGFTKHVDSPRPANILIATEYYWDPADGYLKEGANPGHE